jgi:hypothetical protein
MLSFLSLADLGCVSEGCGGNDVCNTNYGVYIVCSTRRLYRLFDLQVWGWADPATGHEITIMGLSDGTVFVDTTDSVRRAADVSLRHLGERFQSFESLRPKASPGPALE